MDATPYPTSSLDQVEHYRDLMAQAVELAEATNDRKLKAIHVDCALRWLALAQQTQYAAERLSAVDAPCPTDGSAD